MRAHIDPDEHASLVEEYETRFDGGPMAYPAYKYLLFSLPIALEAEYIVETGVHNGMSTRILLEAAEVTNGILVSYDVEDYQETRDAIEDEGYPTYRWIYNVMESAEGGQQWDGGPVGFLYLDALHEPDYVVRELEAWVPHLSDRAVVVTHDTALIPEFWDAGLSLQGFDEWVTENPEWNCVHFDEDHGMALLWRKQT